MATATTPQTPVQASLPPSDFIPPLESGDHLAQPEFHRRYSAMPEVKKAELVEGVVYLASPVSIPNHATPHLTLGAWLGLYGFRTPGVQGADNGTVILDEKNEFQPDLSLFIKPDHGGKAKFIDSLLHAAPELAIEVAASSVSYDLHAKLRAYQRNGADEYLVWRVLDRQLDWFVLENGNYVKLQPSYGVFRSRVFPGLWLHVESLLQSDFEKLESTLREGLASPEHRDFVERLAAHKNAPPNDAK